jgi:hypothetical protein
MMVQNTKFEVFPDEEDSMEIHGGTVRRFWRGGARFFACNFPGCDYENDRLNHTRMHFERIHVCGGKPMRRKRKYQVGKGCGGQQDEDRVCKSGAAIHDTGEPRKGAVQQGGKKKYSVDEEREFAEVDQEEGYRPHKATADPSCKKQKKGCGNIALINKGAKTKLLKRECVFVGDWDKAAASGWNSYVAPRLGEYKSVDTDTFRSVNADSPHRSIVQGMLIPTGRTSLGVSRSLAARQLLQDIVPKSNFPAVHKSQGQDVAMDCNNAQWDSSHDAMTMSAPCTAFEDDDFFNPSFYTSTRDDALGDDGLGMDIMVKSPFDSYQHIDF